MSKAKYTHRITKEVYILGGCDLEKAWNLFNWVCERNNWNPIMTDIKVELV